MVIARFLDGLTAMVLRADPAVVGVAIALLGVAALVAAWFAWRNLYCARTIEDMPTAKARSAHQGYAELEGVGRLMDGPPIVAPLSGLPCVWYRYRIEELQTVYHRGRARQRWVTIDQHASTETFWLEDDTGRVAINPEGASVTPRHRDRWQSLSRLAGINKQTDFVRRFVATHGTGRRYRFSEERINPGAPLYVIGMLKNLGALSPIATVDEAVRELLRNWKQDQQTLKTRFDLDQDGRIDQREWMLARAQARREVMAERREQARDYNDGINLVSRAADASRPFIISALTQEEIIGRYKRLALAATAGFFFLGGAALWLFNTRFASLAFA